MARPTIYTQDIADEICRRLSEGESLREICKDAHLPTARAVHYWLLEPEHREFFQQYTRARELQAHMLADEIIKISDDATNDWMERRSEAEKGAGINNGYVLNGDHVQRSRLRVDSRKWYVSKVLPKIYGEKVTAEVSGPNGEPIRFSWASNPEQAMPDPSSSHTTPEASGLASTKAKPDTESS